MIDATSKEDLEKIFTEKTATLVAAFEAWFATESSSIDGSIESKAPAGAGGSIISVRPVIDSKRVVDATLITEEVLGIELPPEIIKPGGYDSCDAMIADLMPKLRAVFIGDLKVKKSAAKQPAEA